MTHMLKKPVLFHQLICIPFSAGSLSFDVVLLAKTVIEMNAMT